MRRRGQSGKEGMNYLHMSCWLAFQLQKNGEGEEAAKYLKLVTRIKTFGLPISVHPSFFEFVYKINLIPGSAPAQAITTILHIVWVWAGCIIDWRNTKSHVMVTQPSNYRLDSSSHLNRLFLQFTWTCFAWTRFPCPGSAAVVFLVHTPHTLDLNVLRRALGGGEGVVWLACWSD